MIREERCNTMDCDWFSVIPYGVSSLLIANAYLSKSKALVKSIQKEVL